MAVPALIAGSILLIPDKGIDILLSQRTTQPAAAAPAAPAAPAPVSTTATSATSATTPAPAPLPPAPPGTGQTPASRSIPQQPRQSQPPPAVDPTVLASGHGTIVNVEGFDLDNGQKADQNTPGMDVSPDKVVTLINAMSYGTPRMAPLPRTNPASYLRCQQINQDAYVQQLKDIRLMHAGDHICVHTNLGNCGVLTLTRIPSDADQVLDFDYTTWDTFCRRP